MSNEKKDDQLIENMIPDNYGFVRNLHLGNTDIEARFKFLEKFFEKTPYYYSYRSVFKLIGGVAGVVLLLLWYFFEHTFEQKYIAIPFIVIAIGSVIIITQWSLLDRSGGTLLRLSFQLLKEKFLEWQERLGKRKRFRALGIKDVKRDGKIEFTDGRTGYIFEVDGNISRTSYPAEVVRQSQISSEYQNTRNCTTTEINITSAARQSVKVQRENMYKKVRKFEQTEQGLADLCELQMDFLSENIEGAAPTIIQYKIVSDPSPIVLEEYVSRLLGFVQGAKGSTKLYKNIRKLNQLETIRFFEGIHSLE